jgi:hypothetical protein
MMGGFIRLESATALGTPAARLATKIVPASLQIHASPSQAEAQMTLTERVEAFKSSGVLVLDPLTPQQVEDALHWLHNRPVFVGRHVVQGDTEFTTWTNAAQANVLCWTLETAVLTPGILERALAEIEFASEYLGVETPYLYSCNFFCTRPGEPVRPDIQEFHRDTDDVKFLPMFFYLTDVGMDGAQELRTHSTYNTVVIGDAGKVFFSDTMREHRGLKPQHSERIVGWARWGISDPPESYKWDRLQPIDARLLGDRYPVSPRLQEAIKLIAR